MVFLKTEQRHSSAPRRFAPSIHLVLTPSYLDQLAGFELQHGHVRAAERLANLAAEMRETCAGREVAR